MKVDFEKGTKICSKCKKELPIKNSERIKTQLMVCSGIVRNVQEYILIRNHIC